MAGIGHRRNTALFVVALLAMVGVLATACGGSSSSDNANSNQAAIENNKQNPIEQDPTPVPGGKLVVGVTAETNGWNPAVNQWADAGSLEGSAFIEPLVQLDKDGKATGFLLDKWAHNDDFTQWDLTLKPNIKFQNGEDLNGDAMKGSLDATWQTGLTSVALKSVYDHIDVTGPLSVKVTLKTKMANYPVTLNMAGFMMAPEMLRRTDQGVVNPIGTGPFVFEEWKQGEYLRAKKNTNYWQKDKDGKALVYLDEIEFRPIIDDSAKEKGLQAGDLDMALTTSADVAQRLQTQPDFKVIKDYTSERTFLLLNTAQPSGDAASTPNPFSNIHARRALAYATDRQAIANQVGEGIQVTTSPYRADGRWGLPEDQTGYYPFDLAKAKQEVEAYKRDTGATELRFSFSGLTVQEDLNLMQVLQSQWSQAGITTSIDGIDQTKYISIVALGGYQAAWMRLYGSTDPDANYVFYSSENSVVGGLSINFTHYTSPGLDKNLQAVRQTDDFAARKAANDAAVKEINQNAINLWLFDTPYSLIANKKVFGLNIFRTQPFGNYMPKPYWNTVWVQKS